MIALGSPTSLSSGHPAGLPEPVTPDASGEEMNWPASAPTAGLSMTLARSSRTWRQRWRLSGGYRGAAVTAGARGAGGRGPECQRRSRMNR